MSWFDQLIRKVHIYAGLLNFAGVIVFGLAGLVVTFDAPDIFHTGRPPEVEIRKFTPPEIAGDREVAAAISEEILIDNSAAPVITRNAEHQMVVNFYSVNGLKRVTVLEGEGRIRIETMRNSVWRFVDNLHATTISEKSTGVAVRAWAWYIEFSIFCLLAMILTGCWMGLRFRWSFRWTPVSLVAGFAAATALFFLVR